LRRVFFHRGQNLVDLALIIGVVGLVFIGMEAYIRRSVQRKVKDLADYIISDKQSAEEDAVARISTFTLDSTMQSKEFQGGGRRFIGDEYSTNVYVPPPEPTP
jgi:hypothetical protein